ncbi:PREDICTED: rRNA-processing protein UTP23 homolog isoform X2 [Tarenaya hassleriana]|uniref:rRNA-processing protein UTP23 homolog isoform X2 n=1 Tax=Tarenaya hassleriana TaxID=28532 RepID=UPI00053C09B1|nr:PREDICTED: rRNA-processing protein UTP23 homolog isoform X2 [Tarenaya hassleriana]
MRVTRQKRNRRTVRFYKVSFGFRHPYKVLCDGTFVHHLVVNQITPADTALSSLLGDPVKLFTTRCQLAELKRMGKVYAESLEAAQMLTTATCNHDKPKAADACILEVIGKNNPEHFFVGSQDVELRKKLHQVPGVPLIFCLRNSLQLEQPSDFQRQFTKTSEEERQHMTEMERKMLEKRTKKILASNAEELNMNAENEEDDILPQLDERKHIMHEKGSSRNGLGVKDRVQFKRKKAKGPNPLSCKKKKKDNEKSKSGSSKEITDKESCKKSRKRSRSRKKT